MKILAVFFTFVAVLTLPAAAQRKAGPTTKPKVDFSKKIADAAPEALPQSPTDGRLQTDAQMENLSGKVKSVIEHSADNRHAKPLRELSKQDYYNESGNMVTSVSYDEGYPSFVTVFGYVDGMRVSRTGDIAYAEGEKPSSGRMQIIVRMEDNLRNPNAPRDSRYAIRHKYTYDAEGRLIEKQTLANSGEVGSRKTYRFEGKDRREERDFGFDGDEWSRTLEIHDAKGHVVERRMYDDTGKVSDVEVNTYTFDSQGNWIVQKTVEKKTVRGKTVFKPLWTTYRTITYYP